MHLLYGHGHDVPPVVTACRQHHSAIQSHTLAVLSSRGKSCGSTSPLERGVHCRLHVGADGNAAALPELHRSALRVCQGELRLATGLSLGLPLGREELALLERLNLRLHLVGDGSARGPSIVWASLGVQVLEIALDALVDLCK